MGITLSKTVSKCYYNANTICIISRIITPLTLISILVPPVLVLYRICKSKEKENLVTNLISVLYILYIMYGITFIEISNISPFEKSGQYEDAILFYVGLLLSTLFSIIFIKDYFNSFKKLPIIWQITRLVIALMIVCYFIISVIAELYTEQNNKIAYYILLIWLCGISIYTIIIIFIAFKQRSRKSIPCNFFVANTVSSAFCNALIWVCIIEENKVLKRSLFPMALIMMIFFSVQCGCCIMCLLIEQTKDKKNKVQSKLYANFGTNILPESESDV